MRGGEKQLGVKLASLMQSETTPEKGVEGINKFIIVGNVERVRVEVGD